VVKALSYKPEGCGFDVRWGEFLNLPNPSGRTNIIIFLGSKVQRVRRADNLTAIYEPIVLDSVGSLTSHNSIGL
jgi:hypothetical protein